MSWNAHLTDDRGHEEGDWNYTHNCNGMIAAAVKDWVGITIEAGDGPLSAVVGPAWWHALDGMYGLEGKRYLGVIIKCLESDPERYRAMNPENGWGDYDSILRILCEMRDAVPDWPTTWRASG